jgi:hypothetical protein
MNYLLKVKFESEAQIIAIKTLLEAQYGCKVRPRGRHSNRKSVLGYKYGPSYLKQNDIPWRKAETVAFYQLSK